MAVLSTAAVAATVTALTTRVRRLLGDTASTTANQRWSDSDIRSAIDDSLAQMYNEVTGADPSSFLSSFTLTYTANADRQALPAGQEFASIWRVEDSTDTTFPTFLAYINPLDAQKFGDSIGWTYEGNAIAILPRPTSQRTLTIWVLQPFIPVSGSVTPATDQHALSINHEELIALGAAVRLQEVDDEVPPVRLARHADLWQQYQTTVARYRGPVYVRNSRLIQT